MKIIFFTLYDMLRSLKFRHAMYYLKILQKTSKNNANLAPPGDILRKFLIFFVFENQDRIPDGPPPPRRAKKP